MLYPRTPIMLLLLPPLEARYVVTGIIALDVLLLNSGGNVARFVHLGGALGGYGLMKFRQNGGDLSLVPRYIEYLYSKYLSSLFTPSLLALVTLEKQSTQEAEATLPCIFGRQTNPTNQK